MNGPPPKGLRKRRLLSALPPVLFMSDPEPASPAMELERCPKGKVKGDPGGRGGAEGVADSVLGADVPLQEAAEG